MKLVNGLCDQLGLTKPADEYSTIQDIMSRSYATVSEAIFMSIVGEKSLTIETKRTKIQKQLARVAHASQQWDRDVKKMISVRVLREAMSKLLNNS